MSKSFTLKTIGTFFLAFAIIATLTFGFSTTALSAENTATSSEVPSSDATSLNVLDFGAVGDGIQDDSAAFQRAIDAASAQNVQLLIPASETPYLIINTLRLRTNTNISGYGATLFMPSVADTRRFIEAPSSDPVTNITLQGLTLESVNDRSGTGYHINSFTSNVIGIFLLGAENVQITDVTLNNFRKGLQLAWGAGGRFNRNISIDNLQVHSAGTAFYANTTENLVMTNSLLDASAGSSIWLHSAYISADTRNFLFDNVQFLNSSGGGITIGSSYQNKSHARDITVRNSIVDNVRVGVFVNTLFDNSDVNVEISNVDITNYGEGAFSMWDVSNVRINDVNISNRITSFDNVAPSNFVFALNEVSNIQISNIELDATGLRDRVFVFGNLVSDITISTINAFNLQNNTAIMFSNFVRIVSNLVLENSRFESLSGARLGTISLRGTGSNATFRNNAFVNRGGLRDGVLANAVGVSTTSESNSLVGFTNLISAWVPRQN